jgi:hypothetical protein
MLDSGMSLETLFLLAMHLDGDSLKASRPLPGWIPGDWVQNIRDFSKRAHLSIWFAKERAVWEKAIAEATTAFSGVAFKPLLEQFFGPIPEQLVFVPNLLFPSEREIVVPFNHELVCIAPPPLAWGDNPPWSYDDPSMLYYSYRCALGGVGKLLLRRLFDQYPERLREAEMNDLPVNEQFRVKFPSWREQFIELFANALVALYLEDHVSDREYRAFVLIEQRMRGMNILPGTVNVMRHFLNERGRKFNSLMEWLPVFPKQLRIAKRMVSL